MMVHGTVRDDVNHGLDYCFVTFLNKHKMIVANIYRHPKQKINWFDNLDKLLEILVPQIWNSLLLVILTVIF